MSLLSLLLDTTDDSDDGIAVPNVAIATTIGFTEQIREVDMVLMNITSGWTGRLGPFTLKVDGVALDLVGLTIGLVLRKPNGSLVTLAGEITQESDTTAGMVYYTPGAADFVWVSGGAERQIFKLHWQVTDGDDKVVFFPNGDADEIGVYRA